MRITVNDGEARRREVSFEIALKVLNIQRYAGGQLSDATLDAIAKDLGPMLPEGTG